jgi:hypothetical protein
LQSILAVAGLAIMCLYLAANKTVLEQHGLLAVELSCVTTKKIAFSIVNAVRTTNPEFFLFESMYRVFHKSRITENFRLYVSGGF